MADQSINLNGFKASITIRAMSSSAGIMPSIKLSSQNFVHLIRDSQYAMVGKPCIGVSLPTAELKFSLAKPQTAINLLRADHTKVDIAESPTFKKGDNPSSLHSTYDVTNYDIDMSGGGVTITFYMVSDVGFLANKAVQKAYGTQDSPVSSIEAIYDSMTTAQMEVEVDANADSDLQVTKTFNTEDKQAWIQPQTTTLQFISQTIKHCNPQNNDLILSAVTTDKKLRLVSYNGSMKKPKNKVDAYIYLAKPKSNPNTNSNAVSLIASSINLESSIGVYSYLTGVKSIPQIRMLSNKQNIFAKIADLIAPPKPKDPSDDEDPLATERIVAPLIDCGNTHEHYWDAQFANERKLTKIYRNIIYVTIDALALDNSLRVLDTAYVNFKGIEQGDATNATFLEGNFIVLGISRYVSHNQVSNRIALGRESY